MFLDMAASYTYPYSSLRSCPAFGSVFARGHMCVLHALSLRI